MELDDLKRAWNENKTGVQKQHNFIPENFENMTSYKYRSKVKRIIIPEIAGSIVCLVAAAFIGFSFDKLDTGILQSAGVLAILLLLLLPVISTLSVWGLIKPVNVNRPYAETLKSFAIQKIRFIQLQKLNITLAYLLLVTIVVLISKFLTGNDLSANKYYWIFSFPIGYIFLLFYAGWVKKYYRRTIRQAEELLEELG